jgi:uncharacterized phosphatase
MKHLYFVRHGLSVMNQRGIFSSSTDTPLNDEGREQAALAGKELQTANIDCIVSSPTKRTLETARIIAEQLGYPADKILECTDFRERDFGPLEGKPYVAHLAHQTKGVEEADALLARVQKGLDYLHSLDATNILVVSHGAVGRALRHCVDPNTPFFPSHGFANAKIVQLL